MVRINLSSWVMFKFEKLHYKSIGVVAQIFVIDTSQHMQAAPQIQCIFCKYFSENTTTEKVAGKLLKWRY